MGLGHRPADVPTQGRTASESHNPKHPLMDAHQQNLFSLDPPDRHVESESEATIATVVFADPPFGPYDYRIPDNFLQHVLQGQRLQVPLGAGNRSVTGYCTKVETRRGRFSRYKEIKSIIDEKPLVTPRMLELTSWMAEHYICHWGQVLEAVVPAGVRGQAGTREQLFLSVSTAVTARLTQLKLPPKQAAVLRALASSSTPLTPQQVAKAADCTQGPINALRNKQLIHTERRRIQQAELVEHAVTAEDPKTLNSDQQQALDVITRQIHAASSATTLVHGITGSGKTEVYIRAIDEVIRQGRQAIVLVPEISLTPQTKQRFRSRFERVAVLHSHLSATERHWQWQRIVEGDIDVVVGARSAIFAPTPQLGLIVLDEEHDASFKQDNVPRYQARDVALKRARIEEIPLVLGSATPSLESWQQAQQGRFELVRLPQRVLNRPLPDVATIDLRTEQQTRGSRGAIGRQMHQEIQRALRDAGQVILLLNRRGFSTSIQCPQCGHVVKCDDCDIALTHHREKDHVRCHYCDYQATAPARCPECQFDAIRYAGLGTQKLEAEVRRRFPEASVLRMDSDSMQRPGSHEQALSKFRAGAVQILVGTQMIAKGLDFPNVTLVGVINADTALHFPDFRSAERTFQLVTQVAGRTGRGDKGGRVLVQTFSPEHPAIQAAARHDYHAFAANELPTRQQFGYPPYGRMIRLVVQGPQEKTTEDFSEQISDRLATAVAQSAETIRLLGPAAAPISKLRGRFRFHLLLQAANGKTLRSLVAATVQEIKCPGDLQLMIDVDPLSLL